MKSLFRSRVTTTLAVLLTILLVSSRGYLGEGVKPGLVAFIVVDQLSSEIFQRLSPFATGGIKWLLDRGVYHPKARHDHALTVTCPGHAALITGRHPSSTGIIANRWRDPATGKMTSCVADPQHGVSPASLVGATFGDHLKMRFTKSLVFSVSGKDRGAVMLGGHKADGAYWYSSGRGRFESSSYYGAKADWLARWSKEREAERFFGAAWRPLVTDLDVLKRAEIEQISRGGFSRPLPRALGGLTLTPDDEYFEDLYASPFIDALTLDAAREIVTEHHLGKRSALDLLGISLSAMDSVGHRYGPNSPEVFDTFIRLDQELGKFFTFLEGTVGAKQLHIVLSSDHGSMPLPEYSHLRGGSAVRESVEEDTCLHAAGETIRREFGPVLRPNCHVDAEELSRGKHTAEVVVQRVKELVERCPHVAHVWTRAELEARTDRARSDFLSAYRHSYYAERSPECVFQYTDDFLTERGTGTTHGTPYEFDTNVPVVIVSPGLGAGRLAEPLRTVDVAPTLARLIGLGELEHVDGTAITLTSPSR